MKLATRITHKISEDWKLQGSASSLEDIEKLLKSKWYWSTVEFNEIGKDTWSVSSGKGLQDGLRVVKKGNRYRLEINLK